MISYADFLRMNMPHLGVMRSRVRFWFVTLPVWVAYVDEGQPRYLIETVGLVLSLSESGAFFAAQRAFRRAYKRHSR